MTFGFWRGRSLSDTARRLEAGARDMASVRLRGRDEVDAALFADWLDQARKLETESS